MQKGNKRLVICCDGTWNEPDEKVHGDPADETEPTNVLKVVRGVKPIDRYKVPQIVYYDTGVGTQGFVDKFIGGGLGNGISENIQQAYRFIANNYAPGDELFLFGFSRGAYTVRSLAGFMGAIGLLEKAYLRCVPEAYALYRLSPRKRSSSLPYQRLEQLELPPRTGIPIKFIGVWDTVGALGAPTPFLGRFTRNKVGFHNTQLGADVQNAYHALAVDEQRRPFQPDLWRGKPAQGQTIQQVWFAGVHSNIGGSYRNNGLSNITLKWLVDRAMTHDLEFSDDLLHLAPGLAQEGRLEDSFSPGYMALRVAGVSPYTREIGPRQNGDIRESGWQVPGESIHPSAEAGIGKSFSGNSHGMTYDPRNLIQALADGLPVWSPQIKADKKKV